MLRKIIKIDEDKCVGCGLCANACREGAIGIVDGKAKLLRDDYCDEAAIIGNRIILIRNGKDVIFVGMNDYFLAKYKDKIKELIIDTFITVPNSTISS